ncbi:MaoC/PaaZ C-terminal domain-containing protein [Halomarina rubra]|uniref:MaoC/PaaZ C-terminal domain-containing protein n=1 Tax=Halomarina rubra TaxID=2071873 RepID=A0ABD6AWV2_9EURY|nr:MaoC/PaaZ C-terminal domain-containing protein [Halomarina rubra]
MTFAEFATEYRTADGEHVLSEYATAIETDGAATDTAANAGSTTAVGGREDDRTESPRDANTADDLVGLPVRSGIDVGTAVPEPSDPLRLAEGDVGPTVTVGPFARQDFVRYAGASGDFNPIHYDEPFATVAGHRGVFGQGMLTAGVAAHAVTDFVGVDRVRSFGVRFRSRVWPGDTVTARTVVADDDCVLDVSVERERDGETVLTGTATVGERQ